MQIFGIGSPMRRARRVAPGVTRCTGGGGTGGNFALGLALGLELEFEVEIEVEVENVFESDCVYGALYVTSVS